MFYFNSICKNQITCVITLLYIHAIGSISSRLHSFSRSVSYSSLYLNYISQVATRKSPQIMPKTKNVMNVISQLDRRVKEFPEGNSLPNPSLSL